MLLFDSKPILGDYTHLQLAMGSRLLQRMLIHKLFGIPWDEVRIERTKEGKPYGKGWPMFDALHILDGC
jgi:hypothetical protein